MIWLVVGVRLRPMIYHSRARMPQKVEYPLYSQEVAENQQSRMLETSTLGCWKPAD